MKGNTLIVFIIFMKGNNQASFNTIITPFGWGPFSGLNARSPLFLIVLLYIFEAKKGCKKKRLNILS